MNNRLKIVQDFIRHESFSGILLFIATVLAIIIANSSFSQMYHDLWNIPLGISFGDINMSMSLSVWINDALMAVFFLMIGLEIKREMLIGELSSVSKASFPIVAAIGGMLVPAIIYIAFNRDYPLGFGIPMATDIAFALGILMLLGNRVNPALKLFLMALAVVDDMGAVLVVATMYTDEIHSIYFIHAGITYALIWFLNYKKVNHLWPYIVLGIALLFFIHNIGIHATIAGVLLAFAIPIKSEIDEKEFINDIILYIKDFEYNIDSTPILNQKQLDDLEAMACEYEQVQNPLIELEHMLHGFSGYFIMPLFAFSNAGIVIDMSGVSENIWIVMGVIFGLVVGKPTGIFGFTYVFEKLKIIKKPASVSWAEILSIGFLGGIGFTMSIFITHLAFEDESIISAVKFAIFIASIIAATIGVILVIITSDYDDAKHCKINEVER